MVNSGWIKKIYIGPSKKKMLESVAMEDTYVIFFKCSEYHFFLKKEELHSFISSLKKNNILLKKTFFSSEK